MCRRLAGTHGLPSKSMVAYQKDAIRVVTLNPLMTGKEALAATGVLIFVCHKTPECSERKADDDDGHF